MPGWILAAGLGSIALTALLTFILWRLNAPMLARAAKGDGGGAPAAEHRPDNDGGGGSDGGGGDGSGD